MLLLCPGQVWTFLEFVVDKPMGWRHNGDMNDAENNAAATTIVIRWSPAPGRNGWVLGGLTLGSILNPVDEIPAIGTTVLTGWGRDADNGYPLEILGSAKVVECPRGQSSAPRYPGQPAVECPILVQSEDGGYTYVNVWVKTQ